MKVRLPMMDFSPHLRSLAGNEINSVGLYTFSDLLNLRTL